MGFHRYAVPTYYGGLPVGYDLINDPTHPSVAGSGVAAFVDGQKSGGPNDGTYFVAFGEDGLSRYVNRGLAALAQNTDILDDILHKDLAIPVRTSDTLAGGGGVSSVALTGEIYVGDNGTPNNQDQRNRLIQVVDSDDNEIIDSAGTTVVASLIHDGASNNVLGTQLSGFYTNPTVALTPTIPAGVTFRVYYGERGNLASLPKNVFSDIKIRGAEEVDGTVERQLRDLHAPSALQAWDAPFDATIRALASAGLNERYRRSTAVVGSFTYDTPGDGAVITRDGRAVSIIGTDINVTTTAYPDPQLALLRLAAGATAAAGGAWPVTTKGGDIGVWHELDHNSTNDAGEYSRPGASGPAFLEVIPRDIRAATLGGSDALFYINNTATCTLNPDSLSTTSGKATIQCAAGQHFRVPAGAHAGKTSLRIRYDLVEVEFADGSKTTFVIEAIDSNTRIRVKHLSGGMADFGATAIATARIRIYQPVVSLGGGVDVHAGAAALNYAFFGAPPLMRADQLDSKSMGPAFFSAPLIDRTSAGSSDYKQALVWGGFDTDGFTAIRGTLYGDGSITSFGGRITGSLFSRDEWPSSIAAGANSYELNPYTLGSLINISTPTVHTVATTLTFTVAAAYTPTAGDSMVIFITIPAGSTGPFSAVWPSNFVFSGNDDVIPTMAGATPVVIRYDFEYVNSKWYAQRTDY